MIGQINLDSAAGDAIFKISSEDEVLSIVEIGTWNGAGSTKCVIEGIVNKPQASFYSLECDRTRYELALTNITPQDNVHVILGRIVEVSDLDIVGLGEDEATWLAEDLKAMSEVSDVLEELPSKIDFLILDGGEFSTAAEFNKLIERTTYVFLDDTSIRKNRGNRSWLIESDDFEQLEDFPEDRNGWCLFKRS